MPARVGRVINVYEDGTVGVWNETTNEEWFGRLVVMSGGMICFDTVDERLTHIGHREIHPEKGEARGDAQIKTQPRGTRVKLGGKPKAQDAVT